MEGIRAVAVAAAATAMEVPANISVSWSPGPEELRRGQIELGTDAEASDSGSRGGSIILQRSPIPPPRTSDGVGIDVLTEIRR